MGIDGGFLEWGYRHSWMVYFMGNPSLKRMITRGTPHFRTPPYVKYLLCRIIWKYHADNLCVHQMMTRMLGLFMHDSHFFLCSDMFTIDLIRSNPKFPRKENLRILDLDYSKELLRQACQSMEHESFLSPHCDHQEMGRFNSPVWSVTL